MDERLEMFFQDVENPVAVSELICSLATGRSIRARSVEGDLLPCAVILAALAKYQFGEEIVDDYDALMELQNEHIAHVLHPYKYLASGVVLDHLNGRHPRFDWPQAPYPYLRELYEMLKNTRIPVFGKRK